MKKMKIAQVKLKIDADKKVNTLEFNLPTCSKVLSVQSVNNGPLILFNFMAPSEWFSTDDDSSTTNGSSRFQFIIVNCKYNDFEIDNHNYIDTITIDDDVFAVFYKKTE